MLKLVGQVFSISTMSPTKSKQKDHSFLILSYKHIKIRRKDMESTWPKLSFAEAKESYNTLHLWTQILGKIKLARLPWVNHSWHVTLLVTPLGLTTSTIPYEDTHFKIDLDLTDHILKVTTAEGETREFGLKNISVADFYKKTFGLLEELGIKIEINPIPSELENPVPFDQDTIHSKYQPEHALSLHKALLNIQDVLIKFRSEFRGKCSPVHFFWGSFDLAVSRFSGRKAPLHPGGIPHLPDWVAQEAYSDEVSSCGFWPGNDIVPFAAFYSYAYPEPEGFKNATVKPEEAYYHKELREFILPYEIVRKSENPEKILLDFLHSTYQAAASLAQWDREALEVNNGSYSHHSMDSR